MNCIKNGKYTGASCFGCSIKIKDCEIRDRVYRRRWIPVSERLPKEKGFYIFQLKDGRVHEYYYANEILYGDCDRQFDEPIEEVAFNLNDVLAWQPLPEPCKEVENE